jgi:hypothetical protein
MSALTLKVHPTVEPWLRGELIYLQQHCPTLSFAEAEPGVLSVVAVYHELSQVMSLVHGHTGIFVLDYESKWQDVHE